MTDAQSELADTMAHERIPSCPCCKTNQHVQLLTLKYGNTWLAKLRCLRCQRDSVATRKATEAEAVREAWRAWVEVTLD